MKVRAHAVMLLQCLGFQGRLAEMFVSYRLALYLFSQ